MANRVFQSDFLAQKHDSLGFFELPSPTLHTIVDKNEPIMIMTIFLRYSDADMTRPIEG